MNVRVYIDGMYAKNDSLLRATAKCRAQHIQPMAIGEFGGAAGAAGEWRFDRSPTPLLLALRNGPRRARNRPAPVADATRLFYKNPANPLAHTTFGKSIAAGCEVFERVDAPLRQARMAHRLDTRSAASACRCTSAPSGSGRSAGSCISSARSSIRRAARSRKVLIVAPMSGHYATLLRGTVEAFLPKHDVYITDWVDARMVPVAAGRFDLDDYIDYVIAMLHDLGGDTHVIAVCQPSVPVLAAVALMEARRRSVRAALHDADGRADRHAQQSRPPSTSWPRKRGIDWFRSNVITKVPFPASRRHARRLSGLPAAARLHEHESRPPHRGAPRAVHASGARATAIPRRSTASSMTNISR